MTVLLLGCAPKKDRALEALRHEATTLAREAEPLAQDWDQSWGQVRADLAREAELRADLVAALDRGDRKKRWDAIQAGLGHCDQIRGSLTALETSIGSIKSFRARWVTVCADFRRHGRPDTGLESICGDTRSRLRDPSLEATFAKATETIAAERALLDKQCSWFAARAK